MPAAGALQQRCPHRPRFVVPASRTTKTLRPAELTQILSTGLLGGETRLELGQIPRIIFHFPDPTSCGHMSQVNTHLAPNGGLITCRHVLDVRTTHDERIVIYDNENGHVVPIDTDKCLRPADPAFDVVFIPNALKRQKEEFLPLIAPDTVIAGEDVYSYGYFLSSSSEIATEVTNEINQGYFKGNIVNFSKSPKTPGSVSMSLSYAVVEGLSGGPVLTYHNGPKVVGMCHGNIQSRVTASEILEFKDATTEYRETITRIVEFGRAHHAAALVAFLREVKVQDFIVSSDRIQLTGLSD